MLLSILIHCRNDDYMGNAIWRIQTTLTKICSVLDALDADDIEILLCDWGSDNPLQSVLRLPSLVNKYLRFIVVSPQTAAMANGDSIYSAVHATNVVARRATGEYLLYFDSDIYAPTTTMAVLLDALAIGKIADCPLATTFYWASRHHIPKPFNDTCPNIAEIDAFIQHHHQEFKCDKIDVHRFMGTGCALLMAREMWNAVRGADERLRYWGFSDIDLHERLKMKYRFGGDLENHGMCFYHLEHYGATRILAIENPRQANPMTYPVEMAPNDANWGLATETFPITAANY